MSQVFRRRRPSGRAEAGAERTSGGIGFFLLPRWAASAGRQARQPARQRPAAARRRLLLLLPPVPLLPPGHELAASERERGARGLKTTTT